MGLANRIRPSAQQQVQKAEDILARTQDPDWSSKSGRAFWKDLEGEMHLPQTWLKEMVSKEGLAKLKRWLVLQKQDKAAKRRGRHALWKRFQSQDTGCRMAADGSKKKCNKEQLADQYAECKRWLSAEELQGREVSPEELYDEFLVRLKDEKWLLEHLQVSLSLTDAQKDRLTFLIKKLEKQEKAHNKRNQRRLLAFKCEHAVRTATDVLPLRPEETDLVSLLTLQSFDRLLYLLANGSKEELASYVSDPANFIEERDTLKIIAQDAVPVYLSPSTGKILVN